MSLVYLHCIHKVGNDTVGEHFGNMTVTHLRKQFIELKAICQFKMKLLDSI